MSAADHQHGRVAVGISVRGVALVEPVRSAEIAGIGVAARAGRALLLLEAFQLFQRGQQGPRLQAVAVAGIRDQAQDAVAAAERRSRSRRSPRSQSVPARVTRRGAARSGSICEVRRLWCVVLALSTSLRMASRAVRWSARSSSAPARRASSCRDGTAAPARVASASDSAASNCASQCSAATAISSVLSSMQRPPWRSARLYPLE